MTEVTREQLDDEARRLGVPGPEHLPNKEAVEAAIEAALEAQPSPAFAPVPPEPEERTYTVVGPRRVLDHDPGSTFKATLPLEQERLLIEGGHLKRTKETS